MANELGSDNPIRPATMTRNRTRIRKELEKLIKTLNLMIESGMESLLNILNVRNDSARNITKMIAKVWTFLPRKMMTPFTRTNPGSKKKADNWSPKNCGECDICVPKGPQSQCPLCNAELIGPVNYLKINAELVVTLPIDILKSMAWVPIKHLLINTIDRALAHLIYQGPDILTGLFIRTRKWLTKILSNTPNVYHTHGPQDKVPMKRNNKGRKRKRNTNLTWHHRQKARESLKAYSRKPKTRKPKPFHKDNMDAIPQYDGNDDPLLDIENDDTPLEQVLTSTYGWHKTKLPSYPKGIKFWSDPMRPPDEIIWDDPPPSNPPKINRNFVWKNESDEEMEEEEQIPDDEFERTEIMTINVRSCYSGQKERKSVMAYLMLTRT
mgnify:FL=1